MNLKKLLRDYEKGKIYHLINKDNYSLTPNGYKQ